MMHASSASAMSTASDETPIMSNSAAMGSSSSSNTAAASSSTAVNNGSDPSTSRTGSMRRSAAMAAASALSSVGGASGSGPSSPQDTLNGSANSNLMNGGGRTSNRRTTTTRHHHRSTPADHFHPRLITAQILALQCFHYAIQGLFFQINYLLYKGSTITIDRIFTDQYVKMWHASGWPDVAAIFLSALAGSVLLAVIVEKSKKCLDFCVTYFLLHLMLSTWYAGHLPRTADWWIVHLAATIIMVLVGEYVCSRKELSDIPLLEI